MAYTCKICGFSHSCWCGWKKCKCGMNLWQARIAEKLVNIYKIEDIYKLISLVKERKSEQTILNTLWITDIAEKINSYIEYKPKIKQTILDDKVARELWMKSVYCEYPSFNENAKCIYCWRTRREWHLKPCLYYLTKIEENKALLND